MQGQESQVAQRMAAKRSAPDNSDMTAFRRVELAKGMTHLQNGKHLL